jgi:hypothetical protein
MANADFQPAAMHWLPACRGQGDRGKMGEFATVQLHTLHVATFSIDAVREKV